MRVSREQMAENRERILDTAATLFRERGFEPSSVERMPTARASLYNYQRNSKVFEKAL